MKKLFFTLIAMATMTISAQAMTFRQAQQEALFLSDKMAYELNLSNQQYEAVYEINLNYMLNIDEETDMFGHNLETRNHDLEQVLNASQYDNYQASEWFSHPFKCYDTGWTLAVYDRYDREHLIMDKPEVLLSCK